MLTIYAITANVGAVITSALAGSVGHEGALSLLAWEVLGANMAALTAAISACCTQRVWMAPTGFGTRETIVRAGVLRNLKALFVRWLGGPRGGRDIADAIPHREKTGTVQKPD
jgi:hypothetical protein